MRIVLAGALLAGLAALAGCLSSEKCAQITCSPCPPIAAVIVTDAQTGLPVSGTVVTGGDAAWTCAELEGKTKCTSMQLTTTGAFDVEVTAPGYAPATAHVEQALQPEGCCGACQVYTPASVQLTTA